MKKKKQQQQDRSRVVVKAMTRSQRDLFDRKIGINVSVPALGLNEIDKEKRARGYPNRSALIRAALVQMIPSLAEIFANAEKPPKKDEKPEAKRGAESSVSGNGTPKSKNMRH